MCAHTKNGAWLGVYIHGAARKLSQGPGSNLTYLGGALIYVSDEKAVYLANEDSPPPCPLLLTYRAERCSLVKFSPDCLHKSGYIS